MSVQLALPKELGGSGKGQNPEEVSLPYNQPPVTESFANSHTTSSSQWDMPVRQSSRFRSQVKGSLTVRYGHFFHISLLPRRFATRSQEQGREAFRFRRYQNLCAHW